MTVSIFYMGSYVIDAINFGTISENAQSSPDLQAAVRGNVKSIQVGLVDFNISQIDRPLGGPLGVTVSETDTFIEFVDGSKEYFNGFSVAGQFIESMYNGNLILELDPNPLDGTDPTGANSSFSIWRTSDYSVIDVRYAGNVFVELDTVNPNEYFVVLGGQTETLAGVYQNALVLFSTPQYGTPGGGGGGGNPPSGPQTYNGKYIMTAEADPTQVELLVDGQPLPTGSVVKVDGQKYFKVDGLSTSFIVIEQTPPIEWGWDESGEGDEAWAVLQGY